MKTEELKKEIKKEVVTVVEKAKDFTGIGGKVQIVEPHDRGWAVRPRGADIPTSVHETKDEAVTRAKELATKQSLELVVFDQEGKVQFRHNYA